jgi:hypothetical protein
MLALMAFGFITGTLLGSRYKVLVLVPATLGAVMLAFFIGLSVYGLGILVVFSVAGTLTSLQVGYLAGALWASRRRLATDGEIARRGPRNVPPIGADLAR